MGKTKTSFERFLRASLENRLVLTTRQIQLIQPKITSYEVEEAISKAKWHIFEEKAQNGVTTYTLIDPSFICTCGQQPIHWHEDKACCGSDDCCPEAQCPDVDVEIAWNIGKVRQMLEQRRIVNQ
ncbi:MAG: hypothetical protein NWE93_04705 [Candidatus Bathyarchaeota archaeon]|nr:hypothetical protein [Candidatus Bathyarchaeota archaeon]